MCRDTDITKDYGSILAREAWQIISLGKAAALTLVKHKLFSKGQQDTPTSPQAVFNTDTWKYQPVPLTTHPTPINITRRRKTLCTQNVALHLLETDTYSTK